MFKPRLSSTLRITLGLVSMVTSVLFLGSFFNLVPDTREETVAGRSRLCETAAVSFSLMADKVDVATMTRFLEAVKSRDPDIISLGARRDDGTVVAQAGEHTAHWTLGPGKQSTSAQIRVELFAGQSPWGTFEVCFQPIERPGLAGAFQHPVFALAVSVGLASLLVFYFYLRWVLRHLDPSKVVPHRVREALDTLVEGLLVLDRDHRIVLANRAFQESTGKQAKSLIGTSVDRLPLVCRDESQEPGPWAEAKKTGATVRGRLYELEGDESRRRMFAVSASPIKDEKGVSRGVLATFDDVTRLEEKKRELRAMVDCLRESSEAIKQQNRELERLATRDPLTGVLNRRSFFERFESEWKASERHQVPLTVAMVDVDYFKAVNDNHGHSAGDEVLRQVAEALRTTARETDVVCRYGGEEFVVLMPHTALDDGEHAAERLRQAIAALRFNKFTVTASLGIAARESQPGPQQMLDDADKCLYMAKQNGRNQVVRIDRVPTDLVVDKTKVKRTKEEAAPSPSVPYHAVAALLSALAYRDESTASHSRRVADLCVATAEGLLSLSDCYTLEIAALLHDIGKVGVPDNILLKPGPLTAEEWQAMRRNEAIGVEIVRTSFASPQLTSIIEHYRKPYGRTALGEGVAAEISIPLAARILAIADAYDSMVTDKAYRRGCSQEDAFTELRRCAGEQFDPELVERFVLTVRTRESQSAESAALGDIPRNVALAIGLQIERLSASLDQLDYGALDAINRRLCAMARKHGAESIAKKSHSLESILESPEPDPHTIMQVANELLDLCRAAQAALVTTTAVAVV